MNQIIYFTTTHVWDDDSMLLTSKWNMKMDNEPMNEILKVKAKPKIIDVDIYAFCVFFIYSPKGNFYSAKCEWGFFFLVRLQKNVSKMVRLIWF